jgi:Dolichyl-phosphate-mannose-protein mannosyltransferase
MNGAASLLGERIAGAIPNTILALFAFVCAVGLWRVIAIMGMHVPLDPNEGWNAYLAAAAMAGHPYPDPHGYFVNNYPPLSFYLVGVAGRIIGDNVVAGRIISLVAFLCVTAGIFQTARIMGCRATHAALASLLFMAWLIVGSDYVGMNDPQMLGHALEIAALLLVLKKFPNDIAAAVLFALALFVKHNLVAMPAAVAIWLLLLDRARARRFIGAGMTSFLLGLVLFRVVTGGNLLSYLASARAYSFALLTANVGPWLLWSVVPIAIVSTLALLKRHDKYVVFCMLYAAAAVVLGIGFAGGAGVDTNAFFDADIALSLGVGLALDRFGRDGTWRTAVISAALLVPLALGLPQASSGQDWRDPDFWLHPMADDAAVAQQDIAFVEAHPGRALCETLSYCYWAGKNPEVDVFNTGQQFATGARSDADLIRRIDAHDFSVMEFDTLEPFALGPHVKAAALKAYRTDHVGDDGVWLVPK